MQPPRSRTPRLNLRNTRVLRAIILNTTAGLVTLLILRLAVLTVSPSDEQDIPRIVQIATTPLAWPFRQIPGLNAQLWGEVLIADLLICLLVLLLGLLAAGIVTGWRESDSQRAYRSNPFG